jgi:hypothetical protein
MRDFFGRCRCGAIEVHLGSSLDAADFVPRSDAATCGFCRVHDGVWISDPGGELRLAPANRTVVRRFASREVAFHFCEACGELAYALFDDPARTVGVVRLGLFASIAVAARPPVATCFEDESREDGRARRLARWTTVHPG